VECISTAAASVSDGLSFPISRTYPDGGHGSFTLTAVDPDSRLVLLPVVGGRWLRRGESAAMVFNAAVIPQVALGAKIGDRIGLFVNGRVAYWTLAGIVNETGAPEAFVTAPGFARVAVPKASALYLAMTQPDDAPRAMTLRRIASTLKADGVRVAGISTIDRTRMVLNGHVLVLVDTLLLLALVTAVVGLLGLASSMSTSVLERTREFGVMRSIGASSNRIFAIVLAEGLLIAAMSLVPALLLSVPLTAALDSFLGTIATYVPLPFEISVAALVMWTIVVLLGASLATLSAAASASNRTIREALSHT
jgi:putative ABC transport system permease protein